jgi:hypothetical protein
MCLTSGTSMITAHDFKHWKKALFNFAQRIFKPATS